MSSSATRSSIVPALQAAIKRHLHDAEHDARNLAVMQVLHAAGATWSDVLGPARQGDAYLVELMRFGNTARAGLSLAKCGRAVLHLAAWTPPGMMASAAVFTAFAEHQRAFAVQELEAIVQAVLRCREDGNP